MKANLFKSVKNTTPSLTRQVTYFLDRIRNGNSRSLIERIRNTENGDARSQLKLKLPAVAFNGTFTQRSKDNLKESSGVMILDFDDFHSYLDAVEFKKSLREDAYIFAAWISPSNGVKALYRIMQVEDDKQFKAVYREVAKHYPELDPSGKDISRLCFESYDPEIYVNLDAEVFSPTIILEEEINNIGTVTNIPITDEDSVVNRLIVWFERDIFDNANRNTSIFILASAFNKFGISQSKAVEYAFRYAKSEAPEKEVIKAVKSAYKHTADWNTKSFEDTKRKQQLKNMVASGKSDKSIEHEFKDIAPESVKAEIKVTRETVNPEKFWEYNFKGEAKIKPFLFKTFLESESFAKFYPDDGSNAFIFIAQDDNFLDIVSQYQIKDFVLQNLQKRFEIDIFDIVAEKTKLFTYDYLSILDTADVEVIQDGKDFSMLYYQNTAVKVTKNKIKEIEYDDLDGYVWKNNVINRNYKNVDHHKSQFRSFIWYISGEDVERYNSFKSVIGYLMHSYKNPAENRAIILNDEKMSDNPNGGSGKGLFSLAISKMKNLNVIDGKFYDPKDRFRHQTVSTDCQVLNFDDVVKNFKFEMLFSVITEGITIEVKGKDAIKLPFEKSPKILISTNYTINAQGGSFERRMFEMELSDYFNANHTPFDQFGQRMFDSWSEKEWQAFDKYMINCLQYYLEHGLVKYEHVNLEIRKLKNDTSQEFIDFMEEQNIFHGARLDYRELRTKFANEFDDYKTYHWFKQRVFNSWLGRYLEFKGFTYESISSNGIRFYELTAVSDEAKGLEPDFSGDDPDIPF